MLPEKPTLQPGCADQRYWRLPLGCCPSGDYIAEGSRDQAIQVVPTKPMGSVPDHPLVGGQLALLAF